MQFFLGQVGRGKDTVLALFEPVSTIINEAEFKSSN
jgi:hypothetical protein